MQKDIYMGLKANKNVHLVTEEEVNDYLEKLRQAKETLACDAPLDMAAIDMHEALYILGRITGESVDEKLLDDIFSRFCVGK